MAHLQAEAVKKIHEICDRYAHETTPLMMILSDIQKEYGYIPLEVQELVSARTGISVAEIYGVVVLLFATQRQVRNRRVLGYGVLRKGRWTNFRQVCGNYRD